MRVLCDELDSLILDLQEVSCLKIDFLLVVVIVFLFLKELHAVPGAVYLMFKLLIIFSISSLSYIIP